MLVSTAPWQWQASDLSTRGGVDRFTAFIISRFLALSLRRILLVFVIGNVLSVNFSNFTASSMKQATKRPCTSRIDQNSIQYG